MKALTRFRHGLLTLMASGQLVLIGCVMPSGSLSAAETSRMQAFREYKAVWNSHDVRGITAFYGKNGTLNNPGTGKMPPRATAQWLRGLFTAIPDFHVRDISVDPIGNHMLAEQWVISGKWKKPFPSGPPAGKKPTGKSFTVSGATFFKWQGDTIASETQYYDQMAFLTQLGVIPPPNAKPQSSAK